jgi:hypothetical protein
MLAVGGKAGESVSPLVFTWTSIFCCESGGETTVRVVVKLLPLIGVTSLWTLSVPIGRFSAVFDDCTTTNPTATTNTT